MNYSALIQNRKSVRAFIEKAVCTSELESIKEYYSKSVKRLIPELKTELLVLGTEAREALEGAAGYSSYLVGAPHYLVLLSEKAEYAGENAGYIMEDLVIKLADLNLDSCWLTFTESEKVKKAIGVESELEVAAIVAFGYGVKTTKRLRLNIQSMSNVDITAQRHYVDPKLGINDMVFMNSWGNSEGVEEYIGFFDDMLWEAFYAATLAPSYLNRQAYGFVISNGRITLISKPDEYNTEIDSKLNFGIVLLHFTAIAQGWAPTIKWEFGGEPSFQLPEGYKVVASCSL